MAKQNQPPALPDKATDDPNRHVRDFLSHYLGLGQPPHYAVMLSGPWGIGKTYLARKILEARFDDQHRYVYVSLYGLKSTADIDRALAHALFPGLDSTARKIGEHAVRAIAGAFRFKTELTLEELVNTATASVYVFDDLERCDMPINEALGYINGLVEHDGRKVILLANEAQIKDDAYPSIREKLIGKTLVVRSVFDEALSTFIGAIRDPDARAFLTAQRADIARVYRQSGLENLRILQQSLMDFERIFVALEARHHKNAAAMAVLLDITLAFGFDLRAGRLQRSDVSQRVYRRGNLLRPGPTGEPTAMGETVDRYEGVDLFDPILDDAMLEAVLVDGLVDPVEVRRSLDQSMHFQPASAEAEWRTVWHLFYRPETEVTAAFGEMERKFLARSYVLPGEILHVFSLRLWLAESGLSKSDRATAVTECLDYLEDLTKAGRLEPGVWREADMSSGYGNLGFMTAGDADFTALHQLVRQRQREAIEGKYPAAAEALMKLLAQDRRLFAQEVTAHYGNVPLYWEIPILRHVGLDRFMAVFDGLDEDGQNAVFDALNKRYSNHSLFRVLAAERDWAVSLAARILAEAATKSPLNRLRLGKLVEWRLQPHLDPPATT